jgi:LysM repeat protein
MKKRCIAIIAMFLMASFSYAQTGSKPADENIEEVFVNHTVGMGETVVMIAKKYKITPQDVYEYNPTAVDGLSSNMSLKIPMHRTMDMSKPKKVEDKIETRAGNTDVASAVSKPGKPESKLSDLQTTPQVAEAAAPKAAPQAQASVAKATVSAPAPKPAAVKLPASETVGYIVKSDDTMIEIAYKHNTSVELITAMNQDKLANGLVPGSVLTIKPGRELYVTPLEPIADEATASAAAPVMVTHHVVSGETLHGLCRKYKTTIPDITAANQKALKHGLQIGQTLKIPSNSFKVGANEGAVAGTAAAEAGAKLAGNKPVEAQVAEVAVPEVKAPEVKVAEAAPLVGPLLTESAPVETTPLIVTQDEPVATGTSIADRVNKNVQHKVQNGETLTGLARKYHTTIDEITQTNKKKLRNGLQAGQVLVIPSQANQN